MLNDLLLERALRWLALGPGEEELRAARRDFEVNTGPIDETARDYESRIGHFFEHYFCEAVDGLRAPVARFAAEALPLASEERVQLAGWLRSHRSLFRFDGWDDDGRLGRVHDLWLGGTYRVTPRPDDRQLSLGDRFDGRLVPLNGALFLSPGRVFHPRAVHNALDTLLAEIGGDRPDTATVLNGLLRMRARFFKFESIRAEHVYRLNALREPAFAAPWARPSQRP